MVHNIATISSWHPHHVVVFVVVVLCTYTITSLIQKHTTLGAVRIISSVVPVRLCEWNVLCAIIQGVCVFSSSLYDIRICVHTIYTYGVYIADLRLHVGGPKTQRTTRDESSKLAGNAIMRTLNTIKIYQLNLLVCCASAERT